MRLLLLLIFLLSPAFASADFKNAHQCACGPGDMPQHLQRPAGVASWQPLTSVERERYYIGESCKSNPNRGLELSGGNRASFVFNLTSNLTEILSTLNMSYLYLDDLKYLQHWARVHNVALSTNVSVKPGDNRAETLRCTFAKSRTLSTSSNVMLLPWNTKRHWEHADILRRSISEQRPVDPQFRDKTRRVVWRGAPNGQGRRDCVVRRWQNSTDPSINIGYNKLTKVHLNHGYVKSDWNLKPKLDIATLLQSQIIVMLEGNDVASGLTWALESNSVVMMPLPTVETWAMQGQLRPWVHFLPIHPNGCDIPDKATWCFANQAECEAIARRGTQFINQQFSGDIGMLNHAELPDSELAIENGELAGYFGGIANDTMIANQERTANSISGRIDRIAEKFKRNIAELKESKPATNTEMADVQRRLDSLLSTFDAFKEQVTAQFAKLRSPQANAVNVGQS